MKAAYQHTANPPITPSGRNLEDWVREPSVLFFLGPECSRENPYDSLGWARLMERIEQVKTACPPYDGVHIAAYVVSLLPEEAKELHQAVATSEELDEDLLRFQVAVAELAMRATELYVDIVLEPAADAVRNWSERRASVRLVDVEEALIRLRTAREAGDKRPPPDDELPARVRRSGEYLLALDAAVDTARKLDVRARKTERGRAARPLGTDFEERIAQLFGATEVHRSLQQLRGLTVKEENGQTVISLRGEDVEWLANLVWHSLRFDLPIYPSSEDLAFQLALLDRRRPEDSAHIARPKLSLATQDADHPERVAEALSWVVEATMAAEGLSATGHRLFAAIAEVLRGHALTWNAGLHSDSRGGPEMNGADGDEPPDDAHEFVPVVFSTSFDQHMERALLALRGRMRVSIFAPVLVIQGTRSRHAEFRWVYAVAETTGSDASAQEALESLVWKWVPLGHAGWPVDNGISVVKINGAPLYRELDGLPLSEHQILKKPVTKRKEDRPYSPESILRHALVLSEFELLRNLRIESDSDESFLGVLQIQGDQARRVLFLGHPIHDWLTRIRLLTRLFEPIHDERRREGQTNRNILFSKDIEPVRASLLFWADITTADKDLAWVEATLTSRINPGRG